MNDVFKDPVSILKYPRITKATKAIIPEKTNSPGDAVLSFPPKIVIFLLLTVMAVHYLISGVGCG